MEFDAAERIEWDEAAYGTGLSPVDTDHRILIDLLNRLHDKLDGRGEGEPVGTILESLVDYTGFHFAREEAIQKAVGYPDLARHQALHRNFERTIFEHRDRFFADSSAVDLKRVYDFLHRWLIEHISVEDRALGTFAAGRPEAEEAAGTVLLSDHVRVGPLLAGGNSGS